MTNCVMMWACRSPQQILCKFIKCSALVSWKLPSAREPSGLLAGVRAAYVREAAAMFPRGHYHHLNSAVNSGVSPQVSRVNVADNSRGGYCPSYRIWRTWNVEYLNIYTQRHAGLIFIIVNHYNVQARKKSGVNPLCWSWESIHPWLETGDLYGMFPQLVSESGPGLGTEQILLYRDIST